MRPPLPSRWSRVRRPLRGFITDITPLRESPDLRFLLIGRAAGTAGSEVRLVVVTWLVLRITNSPMELGLVSLAQFIPALGAALVGGVLADIMDRRTLLVIVQALLAVTTTLLAVEVLHGAATLWPIFVLSAATAGFEAVDSPARRAAIPRLVGRDRVTNAVALDQVAVQLALLVAPAAAGLMISYFGVGKALLLDIAAPVISLGTLFFIRPLPPLVSVGRTWKYIAAMREALTYFKNKPAVYSTLLVDLTSTIFGGARALSSALVRHEFEASAAGLGLVNWVPGASALLLTTAFTGWSGTVRRQGRAIVLTACVSATAIAAFGLLSRFYLLAVVLLAIAGVANFFGGIFRSSVLLLAVPDGLRGRVSGVHDALIGGGVQLGNLEAGAMARLTSPQIAVVSGGFAAIVGAILIALAVPAFALHDTREPADLNA